MVVGSPGVLGVAGGELRGGGRLRWIWGFRPWWFLAVSGRLGSSAGSSGVGRWRLGGKGRSWCVGTDRDEAAAELTGEVEDDLLALIDD